MNRHTWFIGFVLALCGQCSQVRAKVLDVLVVTPGLTGSSVTPTITLTGPAFQVALEQLARTYPNLNFSHEYLTMVASRAVWALKIKYKIFWRSGITAAFAVIHS